MKRYEVPKKALLKNTFVNAGGERGRTNKGRDVRIQPGKDWHRPKRGLFHGSRKAHGQIK